MHHTYTITDRIVRKYLHIFSSVFPKSLFQFCTFPSHMPAIGKGKQTDHFVHFKYIHVTHFIFKILLCFLDVHSIKIEYIIYVYSLFVSHSQFSIFTRTCRTAKPTLTSSKKICFESIFSQFSTVV